MVRKNKEKEEEEEKEKKKKIKHTLSEVGGECREWSGVGSSLDRAHAQSSREAEAEAAMIGGPAGGQAGRRCGAESKRRLRRATPRLVSSRRVESNALSRSGALRSEATPRSAVSAAPTASN